MNANRSPQPASFRGSAILRLLTFFLFVVVGLSAVQAQQVGDPNTCYIIADRELTGGVGNGATVRDLLLRVDRQTGVAVPVGFTETTSIETMAFWPMNCTMYAFDAAQLVTLDYLGTGAATPTAGSLPAAFTDIDSMTFDYSQAAPCLFAVNRISDGPDQLIKVNLDGTIDAGFFGGADFVEVGTVTASDGSILEDVDDIAIDPLTGTMYGIINDSENDFEDHISIIDPATGAVTDLGALPFPDFEGLTFDEIGQLFATTGEDSGVGNNNSIYNLSTNAPVAIIQGDQIIDTNGVAIGEDYEAITCALPTPAIEIFLTVDGEPKCPNDPFVVTVEIQNGPTILQNVTVANNEFTSCNSAVGTLNPFQQFIYTCSVSSPINITNATTASAQSVGDCLELQVFGADGLIVEIDSDKPVFLDNPPDLTVNCAEVIPAAGELSAVDFSVERVLGETIAYAVADEGNNPDAGNGIGEPDVLYSIDKASGVATTVGTTGTLDIEAIAFDPSSCQLYAANGGILGTLDLATGAFNPINAAPSVAVGPAGSITLDDIDSLAFDSTVSPPVLFASHRINGGAPDVLFQLDPATGAVVPGVMNGGDYVTVVPVNGLDDVDDLAIDPNTGLLHGILNDDLDDKIGIINKTDGTVLATFDVGINGLEGLDFLPDGSLLCGSAGNNAESPGLSSDSFFDLGTPGTPGFGAAVNQRQVVDAAGTRIGYDFEALSFCAPLTFVTNETPATVTFTATTNLTVCPSEIVRVWTAADACGNECSMTQTLTLVDTSPPSVSAPADLTVDCVADVIMDPPVVTDDCDADVDVVMNVTTTAMECVNRMVITRTWTATDSCDNESSAAQVITVNDSIPPILSCDPVEPLMGFTGCIAEVPVLTFTVGDNCDASAVTVVQTPPEGTEIEDGAVVTLVATDSCGNSSTCEVVLVVECFDLALIKVLASAGPFAPGDPVTFDILVTNQGGQLAQNIVITDTLPAGLTLVPANGWIGGPGNTATLPGLGPLAPGASQTVQITATIDANVTGALTNLAEISAADDMFGNPGADIDSTPDTNPVNDGTPIDNALNDPADEDDHDPAVVQVDAIFDLALIKVPVLMPAGELGPLPLNPGDTVMFDITVTNQGDLTATDINLIDYIPAGLTLVPGAGWTANAAGTEATLDTPIASLAPAASTVVSISFTVDSGANGVLTNFAEIASADDVAGNAATDIDSTPDTTNGNDAGGNPGTPSDNTTDGDGSGAPGDGVAGTDEDDHDPATITVESIFDLALVKVPATAGPYTPGSMITYRILVINQGTEDATGIEVIDYIPAKLSLTPGPDWTDNGDGTASLNTPFDLTAGAQTTLLITLTVNSGEVGAAVNYAEIAAANDSAGNPGVDIDSTPDTINGNDAGGLPGSANDNFAGGNGSGTPNDGVAATDEDDHDPAVISIDPFFDLALIKDTANNGPFTAGDTVSFLITVENQGTAFAQDIELTDYVPAGLTLVPGNGWTLGPAGAATLDAPIGLLAPGATANEVITFTIDSGFSGVITNFTEISAANDIGGSPGVDIDSTPDAVNGNDAGGQPNTLADDTTGGDGSGVPGDNNPATDEDDHDPETITVVFDPVSIGSTVFLDPNNNGMQEAGEAGISGVLVELYNATDTPGVAMPVTNAITDPNGDYFFGGLTPGAYIVYIPNPPAAAPESSGPDDLADNQEDGDDNGEQPGGTGTPVTSPVITLAPGTEPLNADETFQGGLQDAADADGDMTIDFGFVPRLSIGSTVFLDPNDNGLQDAGDVGIPGVVVELYKAGDTPGVDMPEGTATTGPTGDYFFGDLLAGTYFVYIPTPPANAPESSNPTTLADNQTDGDDNGDQPAGPGTPVNSPDIVLAPGTEPLDGMEDAITGGTQDPLDENGDMTIDFGFVPKHSIGSTVFVDPNNNGLQDPAEAGIPGVLVELYEAGSTPGVDMPEDTATTGPTGDYFFGDLLAGTYFVYIPVPPASAPTSSGPTSNADDQTDGDDNGDQPGGTGTPVQSPDIILAPGTEPLDGAEDAVTGGTLDPVDENGDMTIDFGFVPGFDLALIKTIDDPRTYIAGETVSFTITVTNQGGLDASNVIVTDYIPAGLTLLPGPWTPAGTTAVAPAFDLAAGASIDIPIRFQIQFEFQGQIINVAEISAADDPSGNPGNDVDSTPDTDPTNDAGGAVNTPSDNALGGDGTGAPGDTDPATDEDDADPEDVLVDCPSWTGTVFIDNNDNGCIDFADGDTPLDGIDVVLLECDPATGMPAAPGAGTPVATNTTDALGFYEFACLDSSKDYYIEVAGVPSTVAPSPMDCIDNDNLNVDDNGQSECADLPPEGKENCDVPFVPLPFDLALIKTVDPAQPAPIKPGDDVTFLITVSNQGLLPAQNIVLTDTFPVGLALNDPAWVLSGANAVSTTVPGPLAPGASIDVPITFTVASTAQGQLVNLAEISAAEDPTGAPGNDIDSTPDAVPGNDPGGEVNTPSDDSAGGDGSGAPGDMDPLTDEDDADPEDITVECANFSGTVWIDVNDDGCIDLGETLLEGVTVTLFECDPVTGLPSVPGAGSVADTTTTDTNGFYEFLCLDPATDYYIEVAGQPETVIPTDTDCLANDNLNVDENGQSPCVDQPPEGKTNCDVPFLPQDFDLALTKVVDPAQPAPIKPGDDVTFLITVINQGGIPAQNIEITDSIPAGLTLNDPAWILTGASATTVLAGPLAPGASAPVTITFTVDRTAQGQIINVAEISAAEDITGAPGNDIDSTPDAIPTNDAGGDVNSPADDAVGGDGSGAPGDMDPLTDEDDADPEDITIELLSIGSTVFFDNDDSGTQDPGETGIANVLVEVLDAAGAVVGSDTTDANGDWYVNGLAPGAYTVQITTPPAAAPLSSTPTTTTDNNVDGDDNGIQAGGSGTPVVSPVITLAAGTEPLNAAEGAPTGGTQDDLDGDANGDMTIDFGFVPQVSLGSTVFSDADDSGTQDAGEPGLPGVVVFLYEAGDIPIINPPVAVDITGPTGDYFFGSLAPGDYYVYLPTPPVGLPNSSTPTSTTDDEVDGDDNGIQGGPGAPTQSPVITLTPGGEPTNADETAPTGGAQDDAFGDANGDMTVDFGFRAPIFDLALVKEVDPAAGPFSVGDNVTFFVTVTNQGELTATSIQVTDYIPSGLTLIAGQGWTDNGNGTASYSVPVGPLAPGNSITLPVAFTIDAPGTLVNAAEIVAANDGAGAPGNDIDSTPDANPGNDAGGAVNTPSDDATAGDGSGVPGDTDPATDEDDQDPEDILVDDVFDLALIKVLDSAGPFLPGDTLGFTIEVINQGSIAAQNIELVDYTPSGLTLVPGNGWTDNAGVAEYNSVLGPIAPGASDMVRITYTIDPGVSGDLFNVAEISAAEDANGNTPPDADSTPDADPTNDAGGEPGSPADDATGGDGSGIPGDDDPFTDEDDSDPAPFTVDTVFDLALIKTVLSPGPFLPGDEVVYAITVTNQGTEGASNIMVVDYIPAGMSLASSVSWNLVAPQTAEYGTALTLAPGNAVTIEITLTIDESFTGSSLVNVAEILDADDSTGAPVTDIDSTPDGLPGNDAGGAPGTPSDDATGGDGTGTPGGNDPLTDEDDADPAEIPVDPAPIFDLALTKELVGAGPFLPGDTVSFDIVVINQGTVAADNIQVVDYTPAGLTLVPGNGWTAVIGGAVLNTPLGPLAPSATTTATITYMINPSAVGTLVNVAEIGSAEDTAGNTPLDADSTPDTIPGNDAGGAPGTPSDGATGGDGSGAPGDPNPLTDEDDADPAALEVLVPDADLVIIKSVEPAVCVCPGDEVTFTITVSNSGASAVAGIIVTDAAVPACDNTITSLAPGAQVTYTCAANVNASFVNVVIAEGSDLIGDAVTATDSVSVSIDTTAPVVSCGPDVTIACDAPVPPADFAIGPDDCSAVTTTIVTNESLTVCGGTVEYIVTIADECGNSTACTQTVTLVDTVAPGLTCGPDATVQCASDVPEPVFDIVGDSCSAVAFTIVTNTVLDACGGTVEYIITASDECGNESTCTQVITVDDTIAPVVTCGPALTVECDAAVPPPAFTVAADNCSAVTTTIVTNESLTVCGGTVEYIVTASDECGNESSCSQVITIDDTTAPTITCRPGVTVECLENAPPPSFVADADNCGSVSITIVTNEVLTACGGTIEYVITAADGCGNSNSCTQTITIDDTTPPVLTCTDVMVSPGEADSVTVTESMVVSSVSDNCGAVEVLFTPPTYTCDDAPGSPYTLEVIAIDECGNATTCMPQVTVAGEEEFAICGKAWTDFVELGTPNGKFEPSPMEICLEGIAINLLDPALNVLESTTTAADGTYAFTNLAAGSYIVGFPFRVADPFNAGGFMLPTLKDVDGNTCDDIDSDISRSPTAIGSFLQHLSDPITLDASCGEVAKIDGGYFCPNGNVIAEAIPNVACCGEDILILLRTRFLVGAPGIFLSNIVVSNSVCGTNLTFIGTDVGNDNRIDWIDQGANMPSAEVWTNTCSFAVNGTTTNLSFDSFDYFVVATDANGNPTNVFFQTETNIDTVVVQVLEGPPVLIAPLVPPANTQIRCGEFPPAPQTLTFSNECSGAIIGVAPVDTPLAPGCTGFPDILRTWSATNDCGVANTVTQLITVVDDTPPVIDSCPAGGELPGCSEADAPPAAVITATDDCGVTATNISRAVTGTFCNPANPLTVTYTYTVEDGCGNVSAPCVQSWVIVDTTPPVLDSCPPGGVLACTDPVPPAATLGATDNCDAAPQVTVTEATTGERCGPNAPLTITYTYVATDACGNSSPPCVQIFTVGDAVPPVLSGDPADLAVSCDAVPAADTLTATDDCGPAPVVFSEVRTDGNCPGNYTLLRTWTATDTCDNTAVASQLVTVMDTAAPTLAGVPADLALSCDEPVPPASVTATDNCGPAPVVLSEVRTDGSCPGSYTLVRTWTAEDACGNVTADSQTITVTDTEDPVLVGVPGDLALSCEDIVPPAEVSATDNCGTPTVTPTESRIDGNCPGNYSMVRVWTAEDACGNTVSETQTIVVTDTSAPVLAGVPADLALSCDEPVPAATVTATDNCSAAPVMPTETRIDDGCPGNYTLLRVWTAEDACGNATAATQTITVTDTVDPVLVGVPEDLALACTDAIPPANVTATDNCGTPTLTPTEVITPGACPGSLTIVRTWTAEDACGNSVSAMQAITISDTVAPVIDGVPADLALSCDEPIPSAEVSATDNCGTPTVTPEETRIDGACPVAYTLIRVWTAEDACGNTTAATQTITVTDTEDPVLAGVPADLALTCEDVIPGATVSATDNCGTPTLTPEETRIDGDCPQSYTLIRTWTAEDACGNTAEASQTITVSDAVDPVLVGVPADLAVSCEEAIQPVSVIATDNCGAATVTPSETRINGNCPGNYTLIRTWIAEDACGNTSEDSQTITVTDTTDPVLIGVPGDLALDCNAPVPAADVAASDNCGAAVVTPTESRVDGDCPGNYTLVRTWTAEDACGNTSVATQTITVTDTTAPVLNGVPSDLTVSCEIDIPNASVTATDDCSGAPVLPDETRIDSADGCVNSYILLRTWTAEDDCGNSVSATQTITVTDLVPPNLLVVPASLEVSCSAVIPPPTITSTDNCGEPTLVTGMSRVDGDCPNAYTLLRTWTAEDACGNSVTVTQTVTVTDNIDPVLAGVPGDVTVECDNVPPVANVLATDNCGQPVLEFDEVVTPGDCPNSRVITRSWTVIDTCGNEVSDEQIITVIDSTPPVLSCPESPVLIAGNAACNGQVPALSASATDNCSASGNIIITQVPAPGTTISGDTTVTITAVDECSNTSICEVVINVNCSEPAIRIEKTVYLGHDGGASCEGVEQVTAATDSPVTYCFKVVNAGPVTLTNVMISDPALGLTIPVGTLLSGAMVTEFTESVINGDLENIASVTGEGPDGSPVNDDDGAEVDEVVPGIALEKTVYLGHDDGASCPGVELVTSANGSDVTYCFKVTNTGDTFLSGVVVSDADIGFTTAISGTIAPGAMTNVFAERQIAGDLLNTADVTGNPTDMDGNDLPGLPDVTDTNTAEVIDVDAGIELLKTVYAGHDAGASCPGVENVTDVNGSAITYCFVVRNTGITYLSDIVIDDPAIGYTATIAGPLAPGASVTNYFEDAINGSLVNVADVIGNPTDEDGNDLPGVPNPTDDDDASVDELELGSIGDTVFFDAIDDDMTFDPTVDTPIEGVTVTLMGTDVNGTLVTLTDITDAMGMYLFDNLNAGSYTITVDPATLPTNLVYVSSYDFDLGDDDTSVYNLGQGEDNRDQDFGFVTPDFAPGIRVEKTVYAGHDGGASCEGGELVESLVGSPVTWCLKVINTGNTYLSDIVVDDPLLSFTTTLSGPLAPGAMTTLHLDRLLEGTLVNIADVTGNPTDEDGNDLPGVDDPSDEDPAETRPLTADIEIIKTVYPGHNGGASCPGTDLIEVMDDAPVTYCFDVRNTGTTTLTDIIVSDTDLSPAFTVAIPGVLMPGASAPMQFTETAAIPADTFVNTAGVTGTPSDPSGTPLPGVDDVTDDDPATVLSTVEVPAVLESSIGNVVFEDLNDNGVQDPGEPGVPGIDVMLLNADTGAVLDQTTTDENGNYLFDMLPAGNYQVMFDLDDLPAGANPVVPDVGGDDTADSDGDPVTGKSPVIVLGVSEDNPTIDFGIVRLGELGNVIWNDLNGNGVQDPGEPGFEGATVELLGASGTVIGVRTTGEDGFYLFDDLPAGTYQIRVTAPGTVFTGQNIGGAAQDSNTDASGLTAPIVLGPGESNLTIDSGVYEPASLGDTVFQDVNANGIDDENLAVNGLTGIEVILYASDNGVLTEIGRTLTGANGFYEFTGLAPGDYVVDVNLDTVPDFLDIQTTPVRFETNLESGENEDTIDFGFNMTPTAITLATFTALLTEDGVTIGWSTASEVDTLGFQILRGTQADGSDAVAISDLLLANGEGSAYRLVDDAAPNGVVYYFLQDLDSSFEITTHGPARVVKGAEVLDTVDIIEAGTYAIAVEDPANTGIVLPGGLEVPSTVVGGEVLFTLDTAATIEVIKTNEPLRAE